MVPPHNRLRTQREQTAGADLKGVLRSAEKPIFESDTLSILTGGLTHKPRPAMDLYSI